MWVDQMTRHRARPQIVLAAGAEADEQRDGFAAEKIGLRLGERCGGTATTRSAAPIIGRRGERFFGSGAKERDTLVIAT
jgi:hypothetical protein